MNEKLNWTDLRREISKQTGMSEKEVGSFLNALVAQIKVGLSGEGNVRINGLGTFARKAVAARKSVNVATGEPIVIEGYNKVTFTAAIVNKKEGTEVLDPIEKLGGQALEIMELISGLDDGKEVAEVSEVSEVQEVQKVQEVSGAKEAEKPAEPEKPAKAEKPKKQPMSRPWLTASLTVLLFTLALACTYLYIGYRFKLWVGEMSERTRPDAVKVEDKVEKLKVEELNENTADSVAAAAENIADTVVAEPEKIVEPVVEVKVLKPVMPNLGKTLKVETMGEGFRLRWLAQKYYGNRELWVFIYEANKSAIKDPNHIMIGEKVRIPVLADEWKDVNNEQTRVTLDSLLNIYEKH